MCLIKSWSQSVLDCIVSVFEEGECSEGLVKRSTLMQKSCKQRHVKNLHHPSAPMLRSEMQQNKNKFWPTTKRVLGIAVALFFTFTVVLIMLVILHYFMSEAAYSIHRSGQFKVSICFNWGACVMFVPLCPWGKIVQRSAINCIFKQLSQLTSVYDIWLFTSPSNVVVWNSYKPLYDVVRRQVVQTA